MGSTTVDAATADSTTVDAAFAKVDAATADSTTRDAAIKTTEDATIDTGIAVIDTGIAATDAGGCSSLDSFCNGPEGPCVRSWSDAQKRSSWCGGSIFYTVLFRRNCHGVNIVERNVGDLAESFFYDGSTGELVGFSKYLTQSGASSCAGTVIGGSGCAYDTYTSLCDMDSGP
jgi:hypothetical protein